MGGSVATPTARTTVNVSVSFGRGGFAFGHRANASRGRGMLLAAPLLARRGVKLDAAEYRSVNIAIDEVGAKRRLLIGYLGEAILATQGDFSSATSVAARNVWAVTIID